MFKIEKLLNQNKSVEIIISSIINKKPRDIDFLKIKPKPYKKNSFLYRKYTEENDYIKYSDKRIKTIINRIKQLPIIEKIKYVFAYTKKAIKEKSIFKGLRKLKDVLDSGTGECSDYSTYLISVLRGCGIPSRHIIGRVLNSDINRSWHVWVEFYIEGYGWIPCDPYYYKKEKSLLGYEPKDYVILHRDILLPLPVYENIKYMPMLQSYYYFYSGNNHSHNFKIQYIWKIEN